MTIAGNYAHITRNTFRGSYSPTVAYGYDGCAFEIFGGGSNLVDYNLAIDNESLTELGIGSSTSLCAHADNNTFAYNVVYTNLPFKTEGIDQHGNEAFGPIYGTKVYNNSISLLGPDSDSIRCGNCTSSMMWVRNNAAYQPGSGAYWNLSAADEDYNILYGKAVVGPHSLNVNPLFVSTTDVHLQSGSPAIDHGMFIANTVDFDGKAVPAGAATDIGAYER
jgi:hypothetical protein